MFGKVLNFLQFWWRGIEVQCQQASDKRFVAELLNVMTSNLESVHRGIKYAKVNNLEDFCDLDRNGNIYPDGDPRAYVDDGHGGFRIYCSRVSGYSVRPPEEQIIDGYFPSIYPFEGGPAQVGEFDTKIEISLLGALSYANINLSFGQSNLFAVKQIEQALKKYNISVEHTDKTQDNRKGKVTIFGPRQFFSLAAVSEESEYGVGDAVTLGVDAVITQDGRGAEKFDPAKIKRAPNYCLALTVCSQEIEPTINALKLYAKRLEVDIKMQNEGKRR